MKQQNLLNFLKYKKMNKYLIYYNYLFKLYNHISMSKRSKKKKIKSKNIINLKFNYFKYNSNQKIDLLDSMYNSDEEEEDKYYEKYYEEEFEKNEKLEIKYIPKTKNEIKSDKKFNKYKQNISTKKQIYKKDFYYYKELVYEDEEINGYNKFIYNTNLSLGLREFPEDFIEVINGFLYFDIDLYSKMYENDYNYMMIINKSKIKHRNNISNLCAEITNLKKKIKKISFCTAKNYFKNLIYHLDTINSWKKINISCHNFENYYVCSNKINYFSKIRKLVVIFYLTFIYLMESIFHSILKKYIFESKFEDLIDQFIIPFLNKMYILVDDVFIFYRKILLTKKDMYKYQCPYSKICNLKTKKIKKKNIYKKKLLGKYIKKIYKYINEDTIDMFNTMKEECEKTFKIEKNIINIIDFFYI